MATIWEPQGRGQVAVFRGRKNGWSKHAMFDVHNNYIGQATKQTNIKRRKK